MRWRDIKNGQKPSKKEDQQDSIHYASIPSKIKAFLTDMFMIMMPLAYSVTYLVMGGKENMQNSIIARNSLWIVYGIIMALFWSIKGQTPGYRLYSLKVVDKNGKKPSFLRSIFRYLLFVISSTIIVGELIAFFRKDKKTLHDLLSQTYVIEIENR